VQTSVEREFTETVAVPEEFYQSLISQQINKADLDKVATAISKLGIVTTTPEKPHRDGNKALSQSNSATTVLRQKIGTFKALRWSGWHPHIVTRVVYLLVEVSTTEVGKWMAFLGCIASSSVLTCLVYFAIEGPVTASVIIAAIIAGCMFCMQENMITPDLVKHAKWDIELQ
jgi:hypothetical protein